MDRTRTYVLHVLDAATHAHADNAQRQRHQRLVDVFIRGPWQCLGVPTLSASGRPCHLVRTCRTVLVDKDHGRAGLGGRGRHGGVAGTADAGPQLRHVDGGRRGPVHGLDRHNHRAGHRGRRQDADKRRRAPAVRPRRFVIAKEDRQVRCDAGARRGIPAPNGALAASGRAQPTNGDGDRRAYR